MKERCAKLQEQLESAGSQKTSFKSSSENIGKNFKNNSKTSSVHLNSLSDVGLKSDALSTESASEPHVEIALPEMHKNIEIMSDFF